MKGAERKAVPEFRFFKRPFVTECIVPILLKNSKSEIFAGGFTLPGKVFVECGAIVRVAFCHNAKFASKIEFFNTICPLPTFGLPSAIVSPHQKTD